MGRYDDVVLIVPDSRQPDTLATLLTALTPEINGTDALVLVADHGGGRDVPRLVAHLSATVGVRALCFAVPEPGEWAARDALFHAAMIERPGWRWIVTVGNAAEIRPGWLTG